MSTRQQNGTPGDTLPRAARTIPAQEVTPTGSGFGRKVMRSIAGAFVVIALCGLAYVTYVYAMSGYQVYNLKGNPHGVKFFADSSQGKGDSRTRVEAVGNAVSLPTGSVLMMTLEANPTTAENRPQIQKLIGLKLYREPKSNVWQVLPESSSNKKDSSQSVYFRVENGYEFVDFFLPAVDREFPYPSKDGKRILHAHLVIKPKEVLNQTSFETGDIRGYQQELYTRVQECVRKLENYTDGEPLSDLISSKPSSPMLDVELTFGDQTGVRPAEVRVASEATVPQRVPKPVFRKR